MQNNLELHSEDTERLDPLYLDLPDSIFKSVIEDNIRSSIKFFDGLKLFDRQQLNYDYSLGKQVDGSKLPAHVLPYMENIIYEAQLRNKPIALSRLPDLTVEAGNDSDESRKTAEDLSDVLNSDVKKRDNRRLLGLAYKQEPIFFYSIVKCRWNAELDDYEFINVHPTKVIFDHKSISNNTDNMRFFAEWAEMTLKELIMMFPNKEKEIKNEFGYSEEGDNPESQLASSVKVWEVWFDWYDKAEGGWKKISATVWKYKDLILKKLKNPYFDFDGEETIFKKEPEEVRPATEEEIYSMILSEKDEDFETRRVYKNYFKFPRKPYFMMVYEPSGLHPISETSRIEQVLKFQDAVNVNGRTIQDMNIRSRGKHIFDTNSINQEMIDQLDLYNPDMAIGIKVPAGKSIAGSHALLRSEPAPPQLYNSLDQDRSKAFEMLALNATTRGVRAGTDTLGQSQMYREQDFGVIDDIVEETINACAEWQAQWAMQMIKMFYKKPHLRRVLGKDGDVLYFKLSQDLVEDGMEVVVSASGVDKRMRKIQAIENAKLGMSDPLSFFQDTDQPQAKERAKMAMMFKLAPQMYMAQYLMDQKAQTQPTQTPEPIQGGQEQPTNTGEVSQAAPTQNQQQGL